MSGLGSDHAPRPAAARANHSGAPEAMAPGFPPARAVSREAQSAGGGATLDRWLAPPGAREEPRGSREENPGSGSGSGPGPGAGGRAPAPGSGGQPQGSQGAPGTGAAQAPPQAWSGPWSVEIEFGIPGGEDLVLVFWSAPRLVRTSSRTLVSSNVIRRVAIKGRAPYRTAAPGGAAWGGLYLDLGEVPLLVGAFAPPPAELHLAVVGSQGGPALGGEGALGLLGPHEFDAAVARLRDLGYAFPDDPMAPPAALWAARRGL